MQKEEEEMVKETINHIFTITTDLLIEAIFECTKDMELAENIIRKYGSLLKNFYVDKEQ